MEWPSRDPSRCEPAASGQEYRGRREQEPDRIGRPYVRDRGAGCGPRVVAHRATSRRGRGAAAAPSAVLRPARFVSLGGEQPSDSGCAGARPQGPSVTRSSDRETSPRAHERCSASPARRHACGRGEVAWSASRRVPARLRCVRRTQWSPPMRPRRSGTAVGSAAVGAGAGCGAGEGAGTGAGAGAGSGWAAVGGGAETGGGVGAGGAAGAGGGLGALRGGSRPSGSTYVSPSPTRMPRWT